MSPPWRTAVQKWSPQYPAGMNQLPEFPHMFPFTVLSYSGRNASSHICTHYLVGSPKWYITCFHQLGTLTPPHSSKLSNCCWIPTPSDASLGSRSYLFLHRLPALQWVILNLCQFLGWHKSWETPTNCPRLERADSVRMATLFCPPPASAQPDHHRICPQPSLETPPLSTYWWLL